MVRKNNKKVGRKKDILIKPTQKEKSQTRSSPEVPLPGTEQLRLLENPIGSKPAASTLRQASTLNK